MKDTKENLVQYREECLTPAERREIASKAGVASGVARRRRRQLRVALGDLMGSDVTEPTIREALEQAGVDPTNENGIALAMVTRAIRGDVEAARYVRDTLGEKPTETYNLSMQAKPIKSIDLSSLSDEELEALADQAFDEDMAEEHRLLAEQAIPALAAGDCTGQASL